MAAPSACKGLEGYMMPTSLAAGYGQCWQCPTAPSRGRLVTARAVGAPPGLVWCLNSAKAVRRSSNEINYRTALPRERGAAQRGRDIAYPCVRAFASERR